jgi:hypothetical protein
MGSYRPGDTSVPVGRKPHAFHPSPGIDIL